MANRATHFVGMKEFRQNMSAYTKEARDNLDVRIIVLKKNTPCFELKPIDDEEFISQKMKDEVKEAREQFSKGQKVSHQEMMKEFGL